MKNKNAIVIFSDDFRVVDNPALYNAAKNYDNLLLLYIYDENYLGRKLGQASKVFLHHALMSFSNFLKTEYNVKLIIQKGTYNEILSRITNKISIDAIYFNRSYTLSQIQIEQNIIKQFSNIEVKCFKGKLLFDPWEIKTSSDSNFYKVFTPFSKECLKNTNLIGQCCDKLKKIKSIHNIESLEINDLRLLPVDEGDWHKNISKNWNFCYYKIEENFIYFVNNKLKKYDQDRNIPSQNGNSLLSPYLRFGMISPRYCFHFTAIEFGFNNKFIIELLWREFAYHVMFYNQNIQGIELKKEYKNFIWNNSDIFLKKWQQGQTGFDIVDAGMNELWKTGFMHNRVRMITASFLIKDLLIDWKKGEEWFWNTLVDADPAVNPFSWQWVFGSGFDASPYFRIFNPDLQKKKFDPENHYCNKWLPKNWKNSRIVDHYIQRDLALKRYKSLE